MSERDDNGLRLLALVVIIMLIVIFAWIRADYNDIRDLQRRIGQLESERR